MKWDLSFNEVINIFKSSDNRIYFFNLLREVSEIKKPQKELVLLLVLEKGNH